MAWSHSRKQVTRCPLRYWREYLSDEKPPRVDGEAALLGTACHGILQDLLPWRLEKGEVDFEELVTWLQQQYDDNDIVRNKLTNYSVGAALMIESAVPLIGKVIGLLDRYDEIHYEAQYYFTRNWRRLKPRKGEKEHTFKGRATWGGDIDLLALSDTEALVLDWKSGARRAKWGQVKDYAGLVARAHPKIKTFRCAFAWLKFNVLDEQTFTRSEILVHQAEEVAYCDDVEAWTDYPAVPSIDNCKFCKSPCEERAQ